jgi:hypothetical protein
MASAIMGFGRHSVKGCQTQIKSFVAAGVVRFIRGSAVLPPENQGKNDAEHGSAKQERARDRDCQPGDYNKPQ